MTLQANALTTLATVKTELGIETPAAWQGSTAYILGNRSTNGVNVYEVTIAGTSAVSGGPTGTGTAIVDGTVTWEYLRVYEDPYLERLIATASDAIENFCNRSFFKETGRIDVVPGYGGRRLIVEKTPILTITRIDFQDFDGTLSEVDAANYNIEDADVGFVRGADNWRWTVPIVQEITATPLPGQERPAFKITYDAGYVTPEQGGSRTLPFDLEDACVQMVTGRFRARGRDPAVKSEKLMSWGASYGGTSGGGGHSGHMSEQVTAILARYANLAVA